MMKMYQIDVSPVKEAMKPVIQVNPIKVESCMRKIKFDIVIYLWLIR